MHGGDCLNCGAPLAGQWCAACGQRETELRPTVHELLHEALHELVHLDGKIIRTLSLLVSKPGALTKEFLEGKRVRSVTPIRLYLICSLLFFGTMTLMPTRPLHVSITKGASPQLSRAAERVNRDPSILAHALESAFPKAMFILMPLFALVVYAMYWRAERMYVPHFYFAVHYHAFTFIDLTLFELGTLIHTRVVAIVRLVFILALFPYLAIALRRVYGGPRWLTTLKTIAILFVYGFFNLIAMAVIAYVTLRRL